MSEVTQLFAAMGQGQGSEELSPLVYGGLRRRAAWPLASEQPGQMLQATALVHEAWLRLDGAGSRAKRNGGQQQEAEGDRQEMPMHVGIEAKLRLTLQTALHSRFVFVRTKRGAQGQMPLPTSGEAALDAATSGSSGPASWASTR